eukprot:TRINITY_DN4032_c0_g2_i1.p1 TRINITY_DN4032_c0_g2~~TRINITY_DN4032_c0_g2_i1.p1  ORF type:complete len:297 (+),score=58.64 TRINITY_DN4032_c0_g2_i1:59-949(+)
MTAAAAMPTGIYGEESVYRLIPVEEPKVEKGTMYRSRHNAKAPPSYSTFGTAGTSKKIGNCSGVEPEFDTGGGNHKAKKSMSSIGVSVANTVSPQTYLKKSCSKQLPEPTKFVRKNVVSKKTGVPRQNEKPVMGLTTEKNFVVSNAVDNILAPPKRRAPDSQTMIQKSDYGKTPSYLKKIKAETNAEKERKAADDKGAYPLDNKLCLLSESERKELLSCLKSKWEQLNKAYQALTFSMDTMTKVSRKEMQEAELDKLERAIQKLSFKKCIFLYDDMGCGFNEMGIKGCDPRLAKSM